jgi:hypothetical protein
MGWASAVPIAKPGSKRKKSHSPIAHLAGLLKVKPGDAMRAPPYDPCGRAARMQIATFPSPCGPIAYGRASH